MSNQKYNQNNRFHSFDKYQQRKNNQNQVVYPTNNIRNISNYRNNRNYENYLEDDDHSCIRICKQKNPGRFNNYAENNQNKYNYNNYNYKYNNGLDKPNVTKKNEKGFNHNPNKEIKINASNLYNIRALSADKYIENEKNNFNENNLLANEDYKKRRQKKERFHHNNSNNKEFIKS